jgi:hypothetical protein
MLVVYAFKQIEMEKKEVRYKVAIKNNDKEAMAPCAMPSRCHDKCPKESPGCVEF